MIIELMCDLGFSVLSAITALPDLLELPLDLIWVLCNIFCYGSWLVGADILTLFVSSVTIWIGARLTSGIALFVWKNFVPIPK